jgi:hypothetical protein
MVRWRASLQLLVVPVFVLQLCFSACDATQTPGDNACELLAAEREACDASVPACEGELDECRASCLVGLACADLIDPTNEPGALACIDHCAPKFTCDDGTVIRAAWRCDGTTADCAGGEDERQCP